MKNETNELKSFVKIIIPIFILTLVAAIGATKGYEWYLEKNRPPLTITSKLTPEEAVIAFPEAAQADKPAQTLPDRATLSAKEIETWEHRLNQSNISTQTAFEIESYDNIEDITNNYKDYLKADSGKVLIYFGFDECPYCQAFSPKASWYAKEEGVTIYHVNTAQLPPAQINAIKEKYKFQTVPTMILFENGRPAIVVNHLSSVKAIQEIIQLAK